MNLGLAILLLLLSGFGASMTLAETVAAIPGANWDSITPAEAGADSKAIEAVLEYAKEQNSSGLVIVYKGRILAERYWTPPFSVGYKMMVAEPGGETGAREDVASLQKSIVSFLVGVAVSEDLIDIAQPVTHYLGAGWSQASPEQELEITVRHLLTMTSGLSTKLEFEVPPASRWQYNTKAYSQLVKVLEQVTNESITVITANWLTKPTGMQQSGWEPRAWVTKFLDANSIGYVSNARDLARFGLLMLNNGNWGDKNLLSDKEWLHDSVTPSQSLNPAYGYLWWLNQSTTIGHEGEESGLLIPTAPQDLYAAQGALGRKVYIVPSQDLIVTRLGDAPDDEFNKTLWSKIAEIWRSNHGSD